MIKYATALGLSALLSACGADKNASHTTPTEKPQGAIPLQQLQALEKAKAVEAQLQQAEQQRRQALDN